MELKKFNETCKNIISEFVNVTSARDKNAEDVLNEFGNDIVIIDGSDNWNTSPLFHITNLLDLFEIDKISDFHSGFSGIAKSGAVIAAKDLSTFISKFNQYKWKIFKETPGQMFGRDSIEIKPANDDWKTFFKLEYGDTVKLKEIYVEGESKPYYLCKNYVTCVVDNFNDVDLDKSIKFYTENPAYYWKKDTGFTIENVSELSPIN